MTLIAITWRILTVDRSLRSGLPMAATSMRDYWNSRARENPFYFVCNRLNYRKPDLDRFWASGREALDEQLGVLGVRISAGDEVVEVGCGVGRITRVLAERGATVRALDVSPDMLEVARELNPALENVSWLLGDGRSLAGVESSSADACESHVVFQHIPDPEITYGYVREIGRVLRPGGWAAFQVSNQQSIHRKRSFRERLRIGFLSLLGRAPRGQADRAWLGSAVDLDRLRAVADETGLAVDRIEGAGTQFCQVLLRKPSP
jgi:SAM-dependent methyltransferase